MLEIEGNYEENIARKIPSTVRKKRLYQNLEIIVPQPVPRRNPLKQKKIFRKEDRKKLNSEDSS